MAEQQKRVVITRWNEETQSFMMCSVPAAAVQAIADAAFNIELPVEEFGGVVTDDLARRIGAGMVNQLALSNPDLKTINKTTQHPDSQAR